MAQTGLLLITDITGYTKYVHQTELEHAKSSLADLLHLLIDYTRLPLILSKLEGDAVFAYASSEGFLQGQTLVEMLESTYLAFRKALELMIRNTTCTCAACRSLKDLDLKFLVHYGSFTIQKLNEYRELLGNDVNLVHRLTKNHIKEQTGFGAYAAYTEASIEKMGLREISGSMVSHRETFADVGEVHLYVQNMHDVWERRVNEVRITAQKNNMMGQLEFYFPYPPEVMWQYIIAPEFRSVINGSEYQEFKDLSAGRAGIGSLYVCAHGKNQILQPILDWEPFEGYTTSDLIMGAQYLHTIQVVPAGDGTNLKYSVGVLEISPAKFLILKLMTRGFFVYKKSMFAKLRQRIDQDVFERGAFVTIESRISTQAVTDTVANHFPTGE
ncbi:MAG: hypothetical protein A2Y54_03060 [Chloroflexi bacterium RBG_16_51_16]|nr:MAG: hypothetical protein A2Y54_03060 [Chloroflexi bacterium RBG_16_51_16]